MKKREPKTMAEAVEEAAEAWRVFVDAVLDTFAKPTAEWLNDWLSGRDMFGRKIKR